jgi:hypothetical protein
VQAGLFAPSALICGEAILGTGAGAPPLLRFATTYLVQV